MFILKKFTNLGNIEPSAPIQMVSQPNFLSDEKKLEGREGQENRQVPRPSLGNAVYSTKGHMPEKPKLCGKPGDVLQLDEDFSEPRSSNRAGVSGFVERALQQIALSSKRMSSDVKRR